MTKYKSVGRGTATAKATRALEDGPVTSLEYLLWRSFSKHTTQRTTTTTALSSLKNFGVFFSTCYEIETIEPMNNIGRNAASAEAIKALEDGSINPSMARRDDRANE